MELPCNLLILAQLPIPAVDPTSVGTEAWAIIILVGVLGNMALNGLKLWLDKKRDSQAQAVCNVPTDVVVAIRNAVARQQAIADAAEKADARHERNIEQLTLALNRHTEMLIKYSAESQARHRGDRE